MRFSYLIIVFMLGINTAFAQSEPDSSSDLVESYAKYLACVSAISAAYFFDGATARESTEKGVQTCRSEKDEYVNHLVPDVETRVGRSLKRSERRKLDQKIELDTQDEFYLIYSGRK